MPNIDGTPDRDDGVCTAYKKNDERCTKRVSAGCGLYCKQHWKMIENEKRRKELAKEVYERQERELASSGELEGEMKAMTELFIRLSTRMGDLEEKASDDALGGKRMKTVRQATKTVLTNYKGLLEAKDTLMSSVDDVRNACERDRENDRLKEDFKRLLSSYQENQYKLDELKRTVDNQNKQYLFIIQTIILDLINLVLF